MTTTEGRKLKQFWGEGSTRIFLSHVAIYQKDAMELKEALAKFGMAAFVAHKDIDPSAEWQVEIEYALSSMDLLVALLTVEFNQSPWANQEVGIAYERKVPIFPIDRGSLPAGFISKLQALRCRSMSGEQVALKLLESFLKRPELSSLAVDAFITAVSTAYSFNYANSLAELLPHIDYLSPIQERRFVSAFNSNYEVYNARDFYRTIVAQLQRMTGNNYVFDEPVEMMRGLVKNGVNKFITGKTGEKCHQAGTYRSRCHLNCEVSMGDQMHFPLCLGGESGRHPAIWALVETTYPPFTQNTISPNTITQTEFPTRRIENTP